MTRPPAFYVSVVLSTRWVWSAGVSPRIINKLNARFARFLVWIKRRLHWATRLDGFLEFNGNEILMDAGKITHEQAKLHAETEYEKYRIIQDRLFESDFDRFVVMEQLVDKGMVL